MIEAPPYPAFDRHVPNNGYCWWYVDAISDDQKQMITVIAFVGSVFSPYYKYARRQSSIHPDNHCSVNVILYGKNANRWCMTERYSDEVHRESSQFTIGPSMLSFQRTHDNAGILSIDINEKSAPVPRSVVGRIDVDVAIQRDTLFSLDHQARHHWWPVAPNSNVQVKFDQPNTQWTGQAYVDMNWGDCPIENDIDYWTWSRYRQQDGTCISYDVYESGNSPPAKPDKHVALKIDKNGIRHTLRETPLHSLIPTGWRMSRYARGEKETPVILKTLEDTPFYSRSLLNTRLNNTQTTGIHESVSLTRFKHPIVQGMLPFRMPRWRGKTRKIQRNINRYN